MRRIFNITDARLLEHTGVTLEALTTDLADFTAFDPDLNQDKVTALTDLYRTTLEEGGDDMVRGKLGEKTQTLLDVMDSSNKIIKSLRYWVNKAFEDDPAGHKRFRLTKYWKVHNNQPELIAYLSSLATVVEELRPQLEAANAPAELLDSVKTLSMDVEAANNIQENSKGSRGSATQDRVTRLNSIYAICQQFNRAAEYIYDEDPAKREQYRIPGYTPPGESVEESEESAAA